jgi:uncharacterized protein (DUF2252 family)
MDEKTKPRLATAGRKAAPSVARSATTFKERYAAGKALRDVCPREAHAIWKAPQGRPNPVETVLAAEKGRVSELLPLRHGRMVRSPFTFYRGSALAMADDLASTPNTGVRVQVCGDAHLSNFGGFATPERRIIFSINDLDETLPAPWEWDVKRLAASFVVGCRDNRLSDAVAQDVAMTCVRAYRESMTEFSHLKTLELWYRSIAVDDLISKLPPNLRKRALKRVERERGKSRGEEMFPKLVEHKGGKPLIREQLPTMFHAEGYPPGEIQESIRDLFARYRDTLPHSSQSLLGRYEIHDVAIKVVGIGSVGTACWVLLLMAGEGDPLFLQVKEARASVLESHAGASVFPNHGQRVVNGYRLMQPSSDMFLGWSGTPKRDYFIRQLRDIKIGLVVETFGHSEMNIYANWCGTALALSHSRSGCSVTLSGYMGKSDAFDKAIAAFSVAYADQNEKDHAALDRAIRSGKVKALFEKVQ